MMEKVKLGIIGIGNMGSAHAKYIKDGKCPDLEIVAIADIDPARLEWAKTQGFGDNIAYFNDAMALLDSGLAEACIISVPHYDHPPLTIACIERGIHVMTEKPAGVYTKAVREMNAAAAKRPDVKFGMMFNQRTNCIYRKLRELVQSGEYGEIRRVNWIITEWYRPQAYYNSGGWRATWSGEGGGVLLNQCPHQLDLLQWICGMPKRVQAQVHYGKWHDIEVEDDVTAYLEYENGATGVFVTSTGDTYGTNRLEIQMDKARFVVENSAIQMDEYEQTEQEFSAVNTAIFGKVPAEHKIVETDGLHLCHAGVLNAWADAIHGKGEMVARGEEGINGLTLSNAMHLSSFLGKMVELPLDEDLYYEELMKRVATSKAKKETVQVFADADATMGSTNSGA